MKKPASLWLKTFAVGFAVISALLVWTLFTPPSYGDLTRIGRLSENQFGWTHTPPVVEPHLLHSAPLGEADVLVVGDSFSMTLYWQSDLVRAGYKVATTYWGEIGYLCEDFGQWVRGQGFKGSLVIVESVERAFDERLQRSEACAQIAQGRKLHIRPDPFLGPLTQKPASAFNWSAKLTTGLITWRNTRRTTKEPGDTQHGDEVIVRVVPEGCSQFTHRLCTKLPIFKEDIDHGPLTAQTFERMQRLTAAQPELKMLWMVIPNKTTVYLDPDHSRAFAQGLKAHPELGPDLFDFAQQTRHQVKDLYFPNDTHMSMPGQLAMGAVMLQEVRKRLPPPSAPGS